MSSIDIRAGFIVAAVVVASACASSGDTPSQAPAGDDGDAGGGGGDTGSFGDASQSCRSDADCPAGDKCETTTTGEVGSKVCVAVDAGMDAGIVDAAPDPDVPPAGCNANPFVATQLAASPSGESTCIVTNAGALLCWGDNEAGELTDGTTTDRNAPVAISGMSSGVASVAVGGAFMCAVTTGGALSCWGNNQDGTVGDGTTTERHAPVGVSGLSSGVAAVSTSGPNACALTTQGGVLCWGNDTYGALANGTDPAGNPPSGMVVNPAPIAVPDLPSGVSSIAALNYGGCAVQGGGDLLCWGENYLEGEVGDGTNVDRKTPTQVSGLSSGVTAIAPNSYHTCAVTSGGALLCWGLNILGEVGDGTTTNRFTPTQVTGLTSGVATFAGGGDHTCALTTGGGVLCWGDNSFGQLGDGTTTQRLTPVQVVGLTSGVVAIAGGYQHSCALTNAGRVLCWGVNFRGELGDCTNINRSTPVRVAGSP
jgi:alpha-tubulin suppressor-like RCC1 family protein